MSVALISHPDCFLHEMGEGHPEQPARIQAIVDELMRQGLYAKLEHYLAPLATREQIELAHEHDYVDTIFQHAPKHRRVLLDADTSMNPFTLQAALRAAGAVVQAVDLVMKNEVNAAFCNVRPPGHHAEHNKAMGFCFFNNIAIGALYALAHYQLKRVAIVDFDVHHGNGTEDIVRNDERILLCSSFQHPFYPFVGAATKSQHILNLPLAAGTDGASYRKKVSEYWFPALRAFKPEIIFISAGFDAHAEDPLAAMLLTAEDYGWLTDEIKQIADEVCQGRIVSVLEGGYSLSALGESVARHVRVLLNSSK